MAAREVTAHVGPPLRARVLQANGRRDSRHTLSCTILTCPPNGLIEPVHDRVPVVLPPERYAPWLDREIKGGQGLLDLLVPFPAEEMAMYACSLLVNKVENDVPEVIAPA